MLHPDRAGFFRPSGRQDLNLRSLDPQFRPDQGLTCENIADCQNDRSVERSSTQANSVAVQRTLPHPLPPARSLDGESSDQGPPYSRERAAQPVERPSAVPGADVRLPSHRGLPMYGHDQRDRQQNTGHVVEPPPQQPPRYLRSPPGFSVYGPAPTLLIGVEATAIVSEIAPVV